MKLKNVYIIVAALTCSSGLIANWNPIKEIHKAVHHVHDQIKHSVSKAQNLAEKAAQSAKEAAQAAANKAHDTAEKAARQAQDSARQLAEHLKAAQEQAKKATEQAKKMAEKSLTVSQELSRKVKNLAQNTTRKALTEAKKDTYKVGDAFKAAAKKIKDGVMKAVNFIKVIVGKGPKDKKPNWMQVYAQALHEALAELKGKDGFKENAYKVLAALVLNKDLAMHKNISWSQFVSLLAPYKFNYTQEQMKALQEAFEHGTPIPDAVEPKQDLSGIIIGQLVKTINEQLPNFEKNFKDEFAKSGVAPDYLKQHPEILLNAKEDFIAQVWEGAGPDMREQGVTWEQLKKELKQYLLDEEHETAIKTALGNQGPLKVLTVIQQHYRPTQPVQDEPNGHAADEKAPEEESESDSEADEDGYNGDGE